VHTHTHKIILWGAHFNPLPWGPKTDVMPLVTYVNYRWPNPLGAD